MNVGPVTAIESRRSCDEQAASRSRFAACLYWPSPSMRKRERDAGLETSAEPEYWERSYGRFFILFFER